MNHCRTYPSLPLKALLGFPSFPFGQKTIHYLQGLHLAKEYGMNGPGKLRVLPTNCSNIFSLITAAKEFSMLQCSSL